MDLDFTVRKQYTVKLLMDNKELAVQPSDKKILYAVKQTNSRTLTMKTKMDINTNTMTYGVAFKGEHTHYHQSPTEAWNSFKEEKKIATTKHPVPLFGYRCQDLQQKIHDARANDNQVSCQSNS
jgi:hypothetical protein